ncbi:mucin-4 [Musca domestica]|uniref:Mucin-4 n=1 Tax=Musca domestica TaxID=7370 RepID=A0A1I8MCQ7_MUSDO|nr:mucin-4 [Musca domestica]
MDDDTIQKQSSTAEHKDAAAELCRGELTSRDQPKEGVAMPHPLAEELPSPTTPMDEGGGPLSKSDKAVSTYGIPDLEDYQRAVTYELVFNSLLEKKMQAMKRDCEERKRNKRLKRKSIGRIFLAKRLFSSVDSRKSSMLSESAGGSVDKIMQAHSEPTTPQKLTKMPMQKTAIRKDHVQAQSLDIETDRSMSSAQSPPLSSQQSAQLRYSPTTRSKSKSNTASSETQKTQQQQPQQQQHPHGTGPEDSVASTLSNSSGKMVKHNVLVMAQTHGTPTEVHTSSSSADSKAEKKPSVSATHPAGHSRELTCDTSSLASGYDNGAGARLNSNTLCEDSLTSMRDSIESLSFASSRCTVSFGATEIIPEDVAYERIKASAKRQRILEAKSISAQCSPILPSRHVIRTMVHAPPKAMSPPVTKAAVVGTSPSTTQPPINIIEPMPLAELPEQDSDMASRRRFLPNQFSYTDSLFESRNISRQNTSEDSANITVSTLLNQSDSTSLHGAPSVADFVGRSTRPVNINDRFKSKSTSVLVALGNGRTRPPPPMPPPCETAQPSPVASASPPAPLELPLQQQLPLAELQQLHIASNSKQKILVDSFKLVTKSPIAPTQITNRAPKTPSDIPSQSLHIVTMASANSELPQQYPVIESYSSSTLMGGPAAAVGSENAAIVTNTTTTAATTTTSSLNDDTAKLHRMTSTSTGSSIGPTGCCTTTKSSGSRLKEKQHRFPAQHIIPSGQSGSDDEYRRKKRKYKRYHRCSDPVLVYPATSGLQHCILSMPPNDPIQYPYTEDYAYDIQLQMESDKNDDLEKIVPSDSTKRKHHKHRHHRHKKRHRHKKPKILVQDLETQEVKVIDPDDLPQRARWTIIATACLLLLMCLMLVGITLRMAPIIDDMGE